ncbi:hypothetical protein HYPSUDRAFT_86820 [Hypholoma sublateritium FD-334 SS-4]|uniref:Uncharacterized protein n=1 Tax=Hypholoma sublateritium (strain FD-334 SS-4) TaxID=945553 RepID=A0A0D2NWS9_HYPSF|nr:hypothetical protein HYPSUDRAFT_86820 [Hypholoma sublateritium FD-334 SS-4]
MEPPPLPLKSPMKPPLITPSASPPPLRTEIRYSRTASEGAPPRKRQRTVSTPRPSTLGTPGPSSSQDPVDIHQERRDSTMRLLEFWDSLASHTRALDDDDIVDIMTGKITRDNGVLRNSDKFTFGSLHDPSTDCVTSDEGSDAEENEFDPDELDAFANDDNALDLDGGDGLALDVGGKLMPPVTPLDPADANDLREFMEAEGRRRELCGTDVEYEEEDDGDSEEFSEVEEGITDEAYSDINHTHPQGPQASSEEEDEVEIVAECATEVHDNYYTDYVVPLNGSDDDELDDWGADAANIVYPVIKPETESVHSDGETFQEVPTQKPKKIGKNKSISNTPSKSRLQSKQILKPPRQLYTPPQSHSSSGPSVTPVDPNFIDLSGDSPPASPVLRPVLVYSPTKAATLPVKKAQEPVHHSDSSSDSEGRSQETSAHRFKGQKASDGPSIAKGTPKRAGQLPSTSRGRTPSHNAFVLLTPRKHTNPQKTTTSSDKSDVKEASPSKPSKGKGKMKEVADIAEPRKAVLDARKQTPRTPSQKSQSTPRRHPPAAASYSSPLKNLRTQTPRKEDDVWSSPSANESISRATPDNLHFLSPTFPSPPIPTKRKRMRSDTDTEIMESDGEASQPVVETSRRPTHVSTQHASTSHLPSDDVRAPKHGEIKKRSSSRRRRRTPESESDSESSASNATADYRPYPRASTRAPSHHPYPQAPYPPLHHPPSGYAPIPDPRAQLIITQAMQQLSALVGAPWMHPHPYHEGAAPHTPSHRHHSSSRPPPSAFATPTHHRHPYPYAYDPRLSHATLPPDSPDASPSSPEKSSDAPRRKSLVRRSRSRGRRVSFHVAESDDGEREPDAHSSPSERRPARGHAKRTERPSFKTSAKGKGRAQTPYMAAEAREEEDALSDGSELEPQRGRPAYSRGQTPGPGSSSPSRGKTVNTSSSSVSGRARSRQSRHDYRGG